MKYKKITIIALSAALLASCTATSQSTAKEVTWITPTGAPTLAFYNQGGNSNWVSSSSPATTVVPAFASNTYDAIVFDGVSGLNILSKNTDYKYKLAQWISGGNFYLVSTKHTTKTEFASEQTVEAFVKTGNASRSFLKLASDQWKWTLSDSNITYDNGVADVKQSLVSNPEGHDYFLLAEPVLTAAKKALKDKSITLNVISNLQEDWANAYNQTTIPAAALFVNSDSYSSNKTLIDTFLKETGQRQNDAVDSVSSVVTALNNYGNDTEVTARFGYTSTLVSALQGNATNKTNKFGILKSDAITDKAAFANNFQVTLGGTAFSTDLFLN
jgi:hypothetical protein